jgi:hypothetical protein
MKRRAQSPDSYTLSIFLTVLSQHPHPKIVLPKAMKLINSMRNKESLVNPNHIHYLQLLQICAKAGDMKNIWYALSNLPEKGPNAPSSQTYTVVLQAIKASLENENLDSQERQELVQSAIEIWSLVVKKWQEGIVTVDSHLLSAMIRVMTLSEDSNHWLSVFDLIEQTTGHSNPRLSNPIGLEEHNSLASSVPENTVFAKVPALTERLSRNQLVRPTVQILEALLEACYKLKDSVLAKHYIENFDGKDQQEFKYDKANFKVYLRLLRRTRSSKEAVEEVRKYVTQNQADWGIFRIAMSTCARNMPTKKTFGEAADLYNLRRTIFPKEPDMKFVGQFVQEVLHHRHVCDLKTRQQMLSLSADDVVSALSRPNYAWSKNKVIVVDDEGLTFQQKTLEIAKELIGQIDMLTNPNRTEKMSDLVSHKPEDEMSTVSPKVFSKTKQKLSEFVRKVEQEIPEKKQDSEHIESTQ